MQPCSSPPEVVDGKVVAVEKGATTAHVQIEIAAGQVATAAITTAAVDSLELTVGAEASDVMVAAG